MLKKILSIFLVLLFLSGCSLPSLQTSGSDVDRTSSTESFSSTEWITTKGTVEDASMNSLLIRTDQAEYFRFSTENAQMELGETGLLLGQQVEVTYLLSQADPIPATTVRLLAEEISAREQIVNKHSPLHDVRRKSCSDVFCALSGGIRCSNSFKMANRRFYPVWSGFFRKNARSAAAKYCRLSAKYQNTSVLGAG